MSYLDNGASNVSDFTGAVISLWFRAPQASIDNCVAALDSATSMSGVIPLVTFGRPQVEDTYQGATFDALSIEDEGAPGSPFAEWVASGPTFDSAIAFSISGNTPLDPSYIGLACGLQDGSNVASIIANLQTAKKSSITAMQYRVSSAQLWTSFDPSAPSPDLSPGSGWVVGTFASAPPIGPVEVLITEVDVSSALEQCDAYNFVSPINLAPDEWHHLLLSFDITNGCVTFGTGGDVASGVTSFSKLWYAVDDVNYDGDNLGGYGSGDPNMILTNTGIDAIEQPASVDGFNLRNGPAQYSLTNAPIPSSGGPIGLPASAAFVDNIFKVEMAEFQLFTGITLDTSDATVRRYFIDADGKPVPPDQKADRDTGKTSGSIEGLGQQPDILLHGSSNWIKGRNTGSTGVDYTQTPPQLIDAGQFQPTAKIRRYKPDPSLHGPQGAAQ